MSILPTFNLIELYEQFPKELTRKEARQECKKRGWYLVDDKYTILDVAQAAAVGMVAIGVFLSLTVPLSAACGGRNMLLFAILPEASVLLVIGGISFPIITYFKFKRNLEKIDEKMALSIGIYRETVIETGIELHELTEDKSHP